MLLPGGRCRMKWAVAIHLRPSDVSQVISTSPCVEKPARAQGAWGEAAAQAIHKSKTAPAKGRKRIGCGTARLRRPPHCKTARMGMRGAKKRQPGIQSPPERSTNTTCASTADPNTQTSRESRCRTQPQMASAQNTSIPSTAASCLGCSQEAPFRWTGARETGCSR